MTEVTGSALTTDFDVMRSVAAHIDSRNGEIRALLQGFIARMDAVPPSVWGGIAAVRFKEVIQRWNSEQLKLSQSLASIATTIRQNEHDLREAAHHHASRIAGAGASGR